MLQCQFTILTVKETGGRNGEKRHYVRQYCEREREGNFLKDIRKFTYLWEKKIKERDEKENIYKKR